MSSITPSITSSTALKVLISRLGNHTEVSPEGTGEGEGEGEGEGKTEGNGEGPG